MEKTIKKIYDSISVSEEKRNEVRASLECSKSAVRIRPALAVCAALALMVSFGAAAYAASSIINIFHTADGSKVINEITESSTSFSFDYSDKSYFAVENNHVYLTVNGEKTDITEYCGEKSYYRYESVTEDGNKSVIFIGGTVDKVGYAELLFDATGTYLFNRMNVPCIDGTNTQEWVNIAMHKEGVPTGDPALDNISE